MSILLKLLKLLFTRYLSHGKNADKRIVRRMKGVFMINNHLASRLRFTEKSANTVLVNVHAMIVFT